MHRKQGNVVSLPSNVNSETGLMQSDRHPSCWKHKKLKAASPTLYLTHATSKKLIPGDLRGLTTPVRYALRRVAMQGLSDVELNRIVELSGC